MAAAAYADVLSQRPTGMVAERATMGLAKARESLGDLEQARRGYEAVANEYPLSPYGKSSYRACGSILLKIKRKHFTTGLPNND